MNSEKNRLEAERPEREISGDEKESMKSLPYSPRLRRVHHWQKATIHYLACDGVAAVNRYKSTSRNLSRYSCNIVASL
eukprot:3329456-Pleurochrysis_carterae.AAC.1